MKKGEFGKRRIRTLVDRIVSHIHECYSLRTVQLQIQFYTVQRDQMNITWVCVTDRPGSFTSQSQCTPSPGFWLNKPAPHEHPHQAGYIITHLTSLQGPVSFIHWATYLPVYLPSVSPPVCSPVCRPNVCFGCHLLMKIIITRQRGVCCFLSQFHDLLWIKKQGYSHIYARTVPLPLILTGHYPLLQLPSIKILFIFYPLSLSPQQCLFSAFYLYFINKVYYQIMSLFSTFYFTFFLQLKI